MHLALYRKYRPKTFEDVVGQEHITTTLKNEIIQGHPAHAYLFTGSRGTGKTTCAKIMAKALNCPNQREGDPCGVCEICQGVDDGSLLDVVEIDAASNNGVDNIRSLREEANFTPAVAKYRVYIIDEAHMLSVGAFNALLKIMEEPPEHVIFILATTEVHKVPATVLSRCQRFDFKRISSQEITQRLLRVASLEGFSLEEEGAMLIAQLSDGGMRDALSLLDLCSSYSDVVTTQTVTQAAGVVGQEHLFTISQLILDGNVQGIIQVIDELSQRSLDPERLCEQLITHYRNLMISRAVANPGDLIRCLPSEQERLAGQSKAYSMERILYILRILQDTLNRMGKTNLRRTELEMAVVKMANPRLSPEPEAMLARIEQLEVDLRTALAGGNIAGVSAIGDQPAAPMDVAKEKGALAVETELSTVMPTDVRSQPAPVASQASPPKEVVKFMPWPEVLERLKTKNGPLFGALNGSVAYQSGNHVLVDYRDDFFLTMMRENQFAKESLKQVIFEVTGKRYSLGPYRPENYTVKKEQQDPLVQFVDNLDLPGEILSLHK